MIGGEREVEGELVCYSNHSGNLKLYNDGSLYYYKLLIADIVDGVHTVYDHTASGGNFVSRTTSQRVNYLKEFALNFAKGFDSKNNINFSFDKNSKLKRTNSQEITQQLNK